MNAGDYKDLSETVSAPDSLSFQGDDNMYTDGGRYLLIL